MDEQPPRKRGTRFTRAARTERVLKRARDGFAYADVAREETRRSARRPFFLLHSIRKPLKTLEPGAEIVLI